MAMKNMFNKLDVEGVNTATPVRALARHKVLQVSMGADHTAVVVEPGHVITFGRNSEGQLGMGNNRPQGGIVEVKALSENRAVNRVQCGYRYTAASTSANELFLWGRRVKMNNTSSAGTTDDDDDSADSMERPKRADTEELHLQPVHILKLNNSGSGGTRHSPPDRELVTLSNFVTFRDDILVQVETTAPPPRRRNRRAALRHRITPENLAGQIKAQMHVMPNAMSDSLSRPSFATPHVRAFEDRPFALLLWFILTFFVMFVFMTVFNEHISRSGHYGTQFADIGPRHWGRGQFRSVGRRCWI